MSQADQIRAFVMDRYVAPARARGQSRLVIRAGDVHREMGLANAMPAVCSAIGDNRFCAQAGVVLVDRQGPSNGAKVYFEFSLDGAAVSSPTIVAGPLRSAQTAAMRDSLNLAGAIVLVSCVKRKLSRPAPARIGAFKG